MIEVQLHPSVRGISASSVQRTVQAALKAQRAADQSVSVYITTNREIRKMNKKYLKHDYATDVISFGLSDVVGNGHARSLRGQVLGDVVVSADFARAYAKKNGIAFREELARYLVHGTLHLLGYDDQKPADYKKMHKRQEEILKKIHA